MEVKSIPQQSDTSSCQTTEVSRLGPIPSLKHSSSGNRNINSGSSTSSAQAMVVSSLMSSPNAPPTILRAVTSAGITSKPNFSGNTGGIVSRSHPQQNDWRSFLTIEERQAVRTKIQNAYTNNCRTYEDLLETVVAIEEEFIHISAPSRLDYFKSGFEFENRVQLKISQLSGKLAAFESREQSSQRSMASNDESIQAAKKSRK